MLPFVVTVPQNGKDKKEKHPDGTVRNQICFPPLTHLRKMRSVKRRAAFNCGKTSDEIGATMNFPELDVCSEHSFFFFL